MKIILCLHSPQEPATNRRTTINDMNRIHIFTAYFYIHFNIICPPFIRGLRHIVFRSSYRSLACCLLCLYFAVDFIAPSTFGEYHAVKEFLADIYPIPLHILNVRSKYSTHHVRLKQPRLHILLPCPCINKQLRNTNKSKILHYIILQLEY